jgi:CHAT domain-containing protein/tetratricopeptide (TPR) repeat protein
LVVTSCKSETDDGIPVTNRTLGKVAAPGGRDAVGRGYSLLESGSYVDAELTSRKILANLEARFGPESPEIADACELLVEAMRRAGRWREPQVLHRALKAVRIKDRYFGSDHPEFAASVFVLGKLRLELAQYEESERLFRSALEIRDRFYGPVDPRVADVLYYLAEALRLQFAWEESKELHQRALSIFQGRYEDEHPDVGKALNGLANALADMGDPKRQAIGLYRQSASIRERTLGPNHPELAVSLHNLAYQLYWDGEYREAQPIAERAVRIQETTLPPEHPLLARTLMYLALINTELGYIEEAQRQYERMVAINEMSLTPGHPRISEANVRYATLLKQIGDYSAARRLLEGAADVYGSPDQSTDVRIVDVLQELADLATDMGDYCEADHLFARGVEILQQERGPLHDHDIYEKQADFWFLTGRREEALKLYGEAAKHWEITEGDKSPEYGRLLYKLARVHHAAGDVSLALPLYERALSIRTRVSGAHHPEVVKITMGLATANADLNDYRGAVQLYRRALDVLERVFSEEHPLRAQCLREIAYLLLTVGERDAAFRTALAAEAVSREHLTTVARSFAERETLRYASVRASGLDLALSLASTPPRKSWTTSAWDALIRSRALVVDEIAARHRAAVTSDDAEVSMLLSELRTARDRLAFLVVAGPSDRNPDGWRPILEDARREKETLERALSERSLVFRQERAMSDFGWQGIAAALPARYALVAFARHRDVKARDVHHDGTCKATWPLVYTAFVASGQAEPVAVPIGSASEIDGLVGELRRRMTTSSAGSITRRHHAERTYRRVAAQVRRHVWDRLEDSVEGAETVILVPDGSLNLLNFGALPVGEGRYLAETGPKFHYMSAERDLLMSFDRSPGKGCLAVGAPAFDEPRVFAALRTDVDLEWFDRAVRVASVGSFRETRSGCSELRQLRFTPLPSTGEEIDQVAAMWSVESRQYEGTTESRDAEVLRGASATETAFKAMAPGRRLIHVATHGFFLGDGCLSAEHGADVRESPLLLSGLALAGANYREAVGRDEDDGILTAEEIAALDLTGAEWAVLSACDTGIGEVRAGEGVFGLRRAFRVAGARTLIMSLWPVEDESSKEWMRRLYENRFVEGMSTADAVHQASLQLLAEQRTMGKSTHPCYWAGFIASGDWR